MNKWVKLGIIGSAGYLVCLLLTFPAARAYPMIVDSFGKITVGSLGDLKLYQLSGTLWKGRAEVATIGPQRIEPITWDLKPLSFLMGEVSLDFSAKAQKNKVEGNISHSLLGTTSISDLYMDIQLDSIDESLRTYKNTFTSLTFTGKIKSPRANFSISDGMITSADGRITWFDGGTKYRMGRKFQNADIGTYVINLSNIDDGVKMSFKDKGGALKGIGEGTLKNNGDYAFQASLTPQPSASRDLANSMQFIGVKQGDGSYRIEMTGSLAKKPAPTAPAQSNNTPTNTPANS